MFTGIVEETGKVTKIETSGGTRKITVTSKNLSRELKLGDSIAVSGVCLTAVRIKPGDSFGADLADETWVRTSFSRIHEGAEVNLELPMKADGRFGGHVVQGHVDGTGKFMGLEPIAGAQDYWLHIELPKDMTKYVVYKGSISVEGISL
ncbi:MAG TPA: riboflavin synthase, partial [Terriglobales bacterium]|nr:riboflavin synthase [Terriglobales bacterium]